MPSQRGGVPRVAVGVGSSAATHAAVRMAAREAALRGYELRLVYGLHRVPEELPDGASFPAAETLLDHATAAARAVAPQLTISTVIHEGTQTAALLRESRFAELLVLDADGLDTSAGWSLDIPAMRLASRADCTVLLARDEGRDEWPVLVGVDPSTGGERALEFAFDAAALRDSDLVVVRVGPDDKADPDGVVAAQLAETVEPWQEKYPDVRVRREVRYGEPAPVLIDLSRDAGLLVVGACGQRPRSAPLAPVAQAVLRHASCATAIVRRIPPGDHAVR